MIFSTQLSIMFIFIYCIDFYSIDKRCTDFYLHLSDASSRVVKDLPLFTNEQDKLDFEDAMNVDLSFVDELYSVSASLKCVAHFYYYYIEQFVVLILYLHTAKVLFPRDFNK